ncbi:hypothetical protein ACTNBL_07720 [Enterococcus villorum]|uniref:Uncharacterized protein n=2 Tax=Enterococcus villorum TaxID=112904 RepID=A0A511J4Q7_9ENTE|nr:hypothetical protein [Enterococcus villorum]EOH88753.1 hypothetical protein UAO_01857 [Enterococcus villorum ATCC 700913]EOW76390.1 hypothetical protein I591_01693 [Enterococcus villorum ATCC 700913]GEL92986.1 hypothetical protein EVI01_23230 [Enterococcus villorum]
MFKQAQKIGRKRGIKKKIRSILQRIYLARMRRQKRTAEEIRKKNQRKNVNVENLVEIKENCLIDKNRPSKKQKKENILLRREQEKFDHLLKKSQKKIDKLTNSTRSDKFIFSTKNSFTR